MVRKMKQTKFKEKSGIKLNAEQEKAAFGDSPNELILAVPGSGKTTTLITRLGWLIANGVDARKLLTITFTKAAANDMKNRYESLFGDVPEGMHISTIHSFCYAFLKEWGKRVSAPLPEIEASNTYIVTKIAEKYLKEYPTEGDIREIQRTLTYVKNMMLDASQMKGMSCCGINVYTLYKAYSSALKAINKIDFDDLLVYMVMVLKMPDGKALKSLARKFDYLFVDEAQDISKVQHEIIELMSKKIGNIFMVGDEDQSIYGFRAAYPEALLNFKETYKDANILYLEKNYRSKKEIIDVANMVIANNSERFEKNMTNVRRSGGKVSAPYTSRASQYSSLALLLKKETKDTAILYRNNASVIPLVYYLRKEGVPYKCRDMDLAFFSTKLVRDICNLYKFAENPKDPEVFMQIYYKLGLKVRKEDALLAISKLKVKDPDLLEPLRRVKRGAPVLAKEVKRLRKEFAILKGEGAHDGYNRIISQIRKLGKSEKETAHVFTALIEDGESMADFVAKIDSLKVDMQAYLPPIAANITLSTIHGSKGLEFSKVCLIDAVDGILPMEGEDVSLEEERRLFYVAITRAKDELEVLEYVGKSSTFLSEMGLSRHNPQPKKNEWEREKTRVPIDQGGLYGGNHRSYIPEPQGAVSAEEKKGFKAGQKVVHKKEGKGVIESVDEMYMTIRFSKDKVKKYSIDAVLSKQIVTKA